MSEWIPITYRELDEEEKEQYPEEYQIISSPLPDDGEEVLITVCGGVEIDTFCRDNADGCYFEGRYIEEVEAWMPLPKPYQEGKNETA